MEWGLEAVFGGDLYNLETFGPRLKQSKSQGVSERENDALQSVVWAVTDTKSSFALSDSPEKYN